MFFHVGFIELPLDISNRYYSMKQMNFLLELLTWINQLLPMVDPENLLKEHRD